MSDVRFSCSSLPTINGHTLHAAKPDADGAYDVIVGAIGIPTRNNVIYDTTSLIKAMNDPSSRFNICLRDGNLAGEYGHPHVKTREDLDRLMEIDEKNISHYFTKIWVGEDVTVNGKTGSLLRAKVIPTGPYGNVLKQQLEDPHHNTSFSIRSLCVPMHNSNSQYEYRQVQVVVTFDAVFAPGFEVATKRYVPSTESFSEIKVDETSMIDAVNKPRDSESSLMVSLEDIRRMYGSDKVFSCNSNQYRLAAKRNQLYREDGRIVPAADLLYKH